MSSVCQRPIAMDPLRRQCAGARSRPVTDFPADYWYCRRMDVGAPLADTKTFCAFCVGRQIVAPATLVPFDTRVVATIACDGPSTSHTNRVDCLRQGAFSISVVPACGPPIALAFEHRAKVAGGVGVFALPTQTDFSLEVTMDADTDTAFAIESFTMGSAVGQVFACDDAERVYMPRSVAVHSLRSGGKVFRFVSVSPNEKACGQVEPDVAAGYGEDNIFSFVLQQYARVRCKASKSDSRRHRRRRSDSDTECIMEKGGRRDAGALSNGTVVQGTRDTRVLASRNTRDTFHPIGTSVTLTLQLACFQTDAEKEVDNARAALHEQGYDYWSRRACDGNAAVARARALLHEAEAEAALVDRRMSRFAGVVAPLYDTNYIPPGVRAELAALSRAGLALLRD